MAAVRVALAAAIEEIMDFQDSDKMVACSLVFANWRVRMSARRALERCGRLAEQVWSFCESQPGFANKVALDKESAIVAVTDHVKSLDGAADTLTFVPIWLPIILKIVIAILIDYWLMRKAG